MHQLLSPEVSRRLQTPAQGTAVSANLNVQINISTKDAYTPQAVDILAQRLSGLPRLVAEGERPTVPEMEAGWGEDMAQWSQHNGHDQPNQHLEHLGTAAGSPIDGPSLTRIESQRILRGKEHAHGLRGRFLEHEIPPITPGYRNQPVDKPSSYNISYQVPPLEVNGEGMDWLPQGAPAA